MASLTRLETPPQQPTRPAASTSPRFAQPAGGSELINGEWPLYLYVAEDELRFGETAGPGHQKELAF